MYLVFFISAFAGICYLVVCQDECGPPPKVEKASLMESSDASYPLGSIITYQCDYGYISRSTSKTSKCISDPLTNDPIWAQPGIVCSPKSCGDPGFVENARIDGSRFTFPSHVDYICDEGYKLSGINRRYCQASGIWSGKLPSCNIINCNRPESPQNGRVSYSAVGYGAELVYECDKGYHLSTSQSRICDANGEWTGDDPICNEIACYDPEKPEFGSMELVGERSKVGTIVVYKCDSDRKLVGSSNSKCIETGEWNFPAPKCVEPCQVPDVANGEIGRYEETYSRYRGWKTTFKKILKGTELDEGEEMILKCDNEYITRGKPEKEITITCTKGELSPIPECKTTSCLEKPPPIENGVAVVGSNRNGHTIHYECNPDFTKVRQGHVKCTLGIWTGYTPACSDTRCDKADLNYPGLLKESPLVVPDGTSFIPKCLQKYEVTVWTDIRIYCTKGNWTGNLLPCVFARCKTENLTGFSGLLLEGTRALNDGDSLQPRCSQGFEFSNKNDSRIYCREGEWYGNMPPCTPAHCTREPPVPENGSIKSIPSIGHGSIIKYECQQFYELDGESSVTCNRGKWLGSLPHCKDTRCYLMNLTIMDGMNLSDDNPVITSGTAVIKCNEGYKSRYPNIQCILGEWQLKDKLSPCEEKDCQVGNIENGEVLEERIYIIKNRLGFQTGTEKRLEQADKGTSMGKGTFLYVKCRDRYKFQGEGDQAMVKITCKRGKWMPSPACLLSGKALESDFLELKKEIDGSSLMRPKSLTTELVDTSLASVTTPYTKTTIWRAKENVRDEIIEQFVTITESEVQSSTTEESVKPPCKCRYNLDDRLLIAHDGKKQLTFGDEVNVGSLVTFYCKDVGYYRFRGPKAVLCSDNCYWHSTLFPACAEPGDQDVTITVYTNPKENVRIGVSGVFLVIPGTTVQLSCRIKTGTIYRTPLYWTNPDPPAILQEDLAHDNVRNIYTYRIFYTLTNVSHTNSGTYTCYKEDGNFHSVAIEVKEELCPEIAGRPHLVIAYMQNRSLNSVAAFHCIQPYQREGPSVAICNGSKEWSVSPPSCKYVQCPEIAEKEYLVITYSQNRSLNSVATFDCIWPYKTEGPSFATCNGSREWSGSTPSCISPTCRVDALYDVVPDKIVPLIDEGITEVVSYGYELNMGCDEVGTVLMGNPIASCIADGKWKIDADVRCVQGCLRIEKKDGSELVIYPEKQFYDMGELITFSCPDGKMLNKEVERVLCFKSQWTPDEIPDCTEIMKVDS